MNIFFCLKHAFYDITDQLRAFLTESYFLHIQGLYSTSSMLIGTASLVVYLFTLPLYFDTHFTFGLRMFLQHVLI